MRGGTRSTHGFTLAEVLLASVILSFVTIGIVQAVTAGHARTLDALKRARADALAEVLLEEVLSKPYDDPDETGAIGPEGDESARSDFDNIDDYHGYSEPAGALADHTGSAYPTAHQVFNRSVSVVAQTNTLADLGGDHTGLQVTVIVREPSGRSWIVQRFVPEPID